MLQCAYVMVFAPTATYVGCIFFTMTHYANILLQHSRNLLHMLLLLAT
jgi:hypothetical protein